MDYPLINGVRHDYSSAEISLKGKKYVGIKEIMYSNKLEAVDVYGAHAQKLGRTRGQLKPTASITMFKQEYQELIDDLGDGYMEVSFDITVSYADTGSSTITDKIIGARFTSDDDSHSEGSDPLIVKCDLNIMYVDRNGKKPLAKMLSK